MRWRAALLLVALGCSRSTPGTEDAIGGGASTALGGGVVARVGRESIPVAAVEAVAAANRISPAQAADRLVADAVAADAARARGLDRRAASWQLVATRARLTADHLMAAARAAGPPTDEEVAALSMRHRMEVDRPPSVRVVHAILLRPKSPGDAAAVAALAPGLARAVAGAPDAEAFEAAAKAYFAEARVGAKESRVETLPAFVEDGTIVDGGGAMDATFARSAFAIPAAGDVSGVVETSFGWHVIRLLERLPERRMPLELRRIAFAEEVLATRGSQSLANALARLQAAHPVRVADDAAALMESAVRAPASP